MQHESFYIIQTAEALKYCKSYSPGHLRLAVILFDNLIEIYLKEKLPFNMKRKFTSEEFERKIKELKHYENITKHAKYCNIISDDIKIVLDFCHEVRNSEYHSPLNQSQPVNRDTEILNNAAIYCQIDYINNIYDDFFSNGFIDEDEQEKMINTILPKYGYTNFKDIKKDLANYIGSFLNSQKNLSKLVKENIRIISEEYEGYNNNDFNLMIQDNYISFFRNYSFENDNKSDIPKINEKKIDNLKNRADSIAKEPNPAKAIQNFKSFVNDYDKIIIAIAIKWFDEQEQYDEWDDLKGFYKSGFT